MRKKLVLSLLLALSLSIFAVISACAQEPSATVTDNNSSNPFRTVYAAYVGYAEENGTAPLSYEAWLLSICGKDGKDGVDGKDGKDGKDGIDGINGVDGVDGVTPLLRIDRYTFYWEVSYDNGKTYQSLGVKALDTSGVHYHDHEHDMFYYRYVVGKPSSCTECGVIFVVCSVCDEYINTIFTEMLPHSYENGLCTSCGEKDPDYHFTTGLAFEKNADGTGYTLVGKGTATGYDINLPDEYSGLPVTAIGDSALYGYNMQYITIPVTVTTIGRAAFYDCYKLISINYKGTVEQWEAITKESAWKTFTSPNLKVYCTDGVLNMNG